MPIVIRIFCVLFVVSVFTACAGDQKQLGEITAEELADKGMRAYNKKKYRRAIEVFQQLRNWYPFSRHAILAEFKIADAHFQMGEYPEAAYAYMEFESLHPRNEAIPYVMYQIGMCYFKSMESIDRDQVATQKALETFKRLSRRFPEDKYTDQAEDKILACIRNLAGHEMYVGRYYLKNGKYSAAINRFNTVLTIYPEAVEFAEEADRFIKKAENELGKLTNKS